MHKRWQIIVSIVLSASVVLVVSYQSTTSLNPAEVFRGTDVVPKIVVGFFTIWLALGIVGLLVRDRLDDHYCASGRCGYPLLDYAAVYGNPIRCGVCRRWFHAHCYKANGATLLSGCMQSPCASAEYQLHAGRVNANVWTHPRTF